MTVAELLERAEVERLSVQPGDVFVVKFPGYLTEEEVHHVHKALEARFPDTDILLVEGGADLTIRRKEEPSA